MEEVTVSEMNSNFFSNKGKVALILQNFSFIKVEPSDNKGSVCWMLITPYLFMNWSHEV